LSLAGEVKTDERGAVLLAGGDSKRLGQPKALLDFCDQTLIARMVNTLSCHFTTIILVTDRPEQYQGLEVKITGDLIAGPVKSPLRGIHAGLSISDLPYQFVAACDMPFLNLDLISYMETFAGRYDAVVPRIGSYYQPLHAFYSRSCLEIIEHQIKLGYYKIIDFYSTINIRYIDETEISRFDPEQNSFININTWEDYKKALAQLEEISLNGNNEGGSTVDKNA
jgi:molybdenum cofactor guanylyltransferase